MENPQKHPQNRLPTWLIPLLVSVVGVIVVYRVVERSLQDAHQRLITLGADIEVKSRELQELQSKVDELRTKAASTEAILEKVVAIDTRFLDQKIDAVNNMRLTTLTELQTSVAALSLKLRATTRLATALYVVTGYSTNASEFYQMIYLMNRSFDFGTQHDTAEPTLWYKTPEGFRALVDRVRSAKGDLRKLDDIAKSMAEEHRKQVETSTRPSTR